MGADENESDPIDNKYENNDRDSDVGLSKKPVSWTSTFVIKVLQENERRSDVTFLVQTFGHTHVM